MVGHCGTILVFCLAGVRYRAVWPRYNSYMLCRSFAAGKVAWSPQFPLPYKANGGGRERKLGVGVILTGLGVGVILTGLGVRIVLTGLGVGSWGPLRYTPNHAMQLMGGRERKAWSGRPLRVQFSCGGERELKRGQKCEFYPYHST